MPDQSGSTGGDVQLAQRATSILSVLAAAACLAACGAPSSTRSAASSTVLAFQAAATDGDAAAICRLLTEDLARSLDHSGQSCPTAVAGLRLSAPGASLATDVWGRSALVTFATSSTDLFLTDINGTWRITAAGCTLQDSQPAECALEGG